MIDKSIYVKDDEVVLVDDCNRFIYEVFVDVKFENIFSVANHRYFTSNKEILNIIRLYKISSYVEVSCSLYSAPKKWLMDNEFKLFVKPEKKKRKTKIINNE